MIANLSHLCRIMAAVGIVVGLNATLALIDGMVGPHPFILWEFLSECVYSGGMAMAHATRALVGAPTLLLGIVVYHFLSRRLYNDGRARCRKCKAVLVGLSKPCCPHCGESI